MNQEHKKQFWILIMIQYTTGPRQDTEEMFNGSDTEGHKLQGLIFLRRTLLDPHCCLRYFCLFISSHGSVCSGVPQGDGTQGVYLTLVFIIIDMTILPGV